MSQDTTAAPDAGNPSAPVGPLRTNLKGLIVGVACLAAIAWAGRSFWDQLPINHLQKSLRSGDVDERLNAARILAAAVDNDADVAVSALNRALKEDADPGVRVVAANGLGMAGSVVWKRSPDSPLGPDAVKALTVALKDRDATVRAEAATALGLLAKDNPVSPPPSLCEVLQNDPAVAVRTAAASALGLFHKDPEILLPPLFDGLGQENTQVRRASFNALSSDKLTPNNRSVPFLIKTLKDSRDSRVRGRAAALLGRVEPPDAQAVAPLIAAMKEPVGQEPAPLVDPLPPGAARLAGPAIAGGGGGGGGDRADSWDLAVHAATALGLIAPKVGAESDAAAALAELMKSDLNWRANAAASALSAVGKKTPKVIPALLEAVRNSVAEDREKGVKDGANSSAARALGEIAPGTEFAREAVGVLTEAIDSPNVGLRTAAVTALPNFGKAAEPAVPKLKSLLDRVGESRADAAIGRQARRAIERIEANDEDTPAKPASGG